MDEELIHVGAVFGYAHAANVWIANFTCAKKDDCRNQEAANPMKRLPSGEVSFKAEHLHGRALSSSSSSNHWAGVTYVIATHWAVSPC